MKRLILAVLFCFTASLVMGAGSANPPITYSSKASKVDPSDWNAFTKTWVPIDGDIETAVSNATAGDTLILAAGTYTITDDIDIGKAINIVGQGRGKTTIYCATASKLIFDIDAANVRISNLSISIAAEGDRAFNVGSSGDNLIVKDVDISISIASGTTAVYGFYMDQPGGSCIYDNVSITSSSSTAAIVGMQFRGPLNHELRNCNIDLQITPNAWAIYLTTVVSDPHVVIKDSYIRATSAGTGYGIYSLSSTASTSCNVFRSVLNGSAYDVIRTAGTVTLDNSTLVNGTTSGTITYDGTVVSEDLYLSDDATIANGGTLQINSAGDDKNIQISHNDTNGLIVSSDGTVSFNDDNITTTGIVTANKHYTAVASTSPDYSLEAIIEDTDGGGSITNAYLSASAASGNITGIYNYQGTDGASGTIYGSYNDGYYNGNVTDGRGYYSYTITKAATTTTAGYQYYAEADVAGALTTGYGYYTKAAGGGSCGTYYGAYIADPSITTLTNDYGLYIEAHDQGATLNYNIYSAGASSINQFEGNIKLKNDNATQYFGAADDATITFDGDSLNITANSVTATDDMILTADDVLINGWVDIDPNSNTEGLRIRGADAANEYADFYVDANNDLNIDSTGYTKLLDSVKATNDGGAFVTNDANVYQYFVNNAKLDLIEDINTIIGTSDIKGFWVFDQTGATTSVTDRSPNAHTLTLGGNASTLSPAVSGLCPNLTMAGTSATSWSVADDNDFSFGDGAGNDSAFTVMTLIKPTTLNTNNQPLVAKGSDAQYEWELTTDASGLIIWGLSNPARDARIVRYYNTTISADAGSWHTYAGTASGGAPQAIAGIKIYRDGVQIDDTSYTAGAYAGMTNGTAVVGGVFAGTYSKGSTGVVLVISKELTAAEVKRVSDRLRAYAGVFL